MCVQCCCPVHDHPLLVNTWTSSTLSLVYSIASTLQTILTTMILVKPLDKFQDVYDLCIKVEILDYFHGCGMKDWIVILILNNKFLTQIHNRILISWCFKILCCTKDQRSIPVCIYKYQNSRFSQQLFFVLLSLTGNQESSDCYSPLSLAWSNHPYPSGSWPRLSSIAELFWDKFIQCTCNSL